MPDYRFALPLIARSLDSHLFLGEALLFPEFTCLGSGGRQLVREVRRLATGVVRQSTPLDLYGRRAPEDSTVAEVEVRVEPPRRIRAWSTPVVLRFDVIRWTHPGAAAYLAYVPDLGIEIVAATEAERDERVPNEIEAELMRRKSLSSLRHLVWLQRARRTRLLQVSFSVELPGPKAAAIAAEEGRKKQKSVLKEVALDLIREPRRPAYEYDEYVERLAEALAGPRPRSVLLVGPSGIGKSAVVGELVARRFDLRLGERPFWGTSGARLIAGMAGFGMWEERCQKICREAAQTRAILHLGNLVELMEVGKSMNSSVGVAGLLRPALARGDFLGIAECTPEQLALIERTAPQLLDAFQQIAIREPTPEQTRRILDRFCAQFRLPRGLERFRGDQPALTNNAMDALDRLHRRYASYSASPGRPLRFLDNLLRDEFTPKPLPAPDEPQVRSLEESDISAAFSRETGLPLFLVDPRTPLDLEVARTWFAERVIGQPEVIDLVVDLLATVKAGLSRPRRPIASLLFIGPTGVGKTEMSKAIATFLFGAAQRLTRFDMSEFADPRAVPRLIGGSFGAEGLLTSKIREQPFSVLLFDEVEKADPQFFDLLLQVLGEGRLTDGGGRLADFSNAVIVMTSNLGAATFQSGGVGFAANSADRQSATNHFEAAVREFVRPELFNRIDRIVPFAPLDRQTVLSIARRQLDEVRRRDGIRYRGVDLQLDAGVAERLADEGYDPRYGARPLKRQIERELLAPLAEGVNRYAIDRQLEAHVALNDGGLRVDVRARLDSRGRTLSSFAAGNAAASMAREIVDLRRLSQRLEASPYLLEIENELYQLVTWEKRLHQQAARKPDSARLLWQHPDTLKSLARLAALRRLRSDVLTMSDTIAVLEDQALMHLYSNAISEIDAPEIGACRELFEQTLLDVYLDQFDEPNRITLGLYSENPERLFALAAAYVEVATRHEALVAMFQYTATQPPHSTPVRYKKEPAPRLWRLPIDEIDLYLELPEPGIIGLLLELRGAAVFPRFVQEIGLHEFTIGNEKVLVLVDAASAPAVEYLPPSGIERRGAIAGPEHRREYNLVETLARDPLLNTTLNWFGKSLAKLVDELMEQKFRNDARALLEEE